ncbi:MAG: hypothetical protein H7138_08735 [Myxococcales bacterium]|nr:hypothetical protein [Myxococcales bacterium]
MERERGAERGVAGRDLKVGAGRVIDIELAAQYLRASYLRVLRVCARA